jgi:hypothetical protein
MALEGLRKLTGPEMEGRAMLPLKTLIRETESIIIIKFCGLCKIMVLRVL